MPQVKIVARNFMDMVASLPVMKLDMLYDNSFICEAILRYSKNPQFDRMLRVFLAAQPVIGLISACKNGCNFTILAYSDMYCVHLDAKDVYFVFKLIIMEK